MMKYGNSLVVALMLLFTLGVTSCMDTDQDFSPEGGGVVEVIREGEMTSFKDLVGKVVYPTAGSLKSVEEANKFEAAKSKTAYILYKYENQQVQNGNIHNVDLRYAAKLDGNVEIVDRLGAKNDSVSTAAILSLDQLLTAEEGGRGDLHVMNNRYLLFGINYIIAENNHFFTVVYNKEEAASDDLKLYLRHTGIKEKDGIFRTAVDYFSVGYPFIYMFTFDMQDVFKDWRSKHPDAKEVNIVVEADVNTLNSNLNEASSKKQFKTTYKFVD